MLSFVCSCAVIGHCHVTSGTVANLRVSGVIEIVFPPRNDVETRERAAISAEEACARLTALSGDSRNFEAIRIAHARAVNRGDWTRASFEFGAAHGVVWLFVHDEEGLFDHEYHRLAGECPVLEARTNLPGQRKLAMMDHTRLLLADRPTADAACVAYIFPPRENLSYDDPRSIREFVSFKLPGFIYSRVELGIIEILDDLFHAASLSSGTVVETVPRAGHPGRIKITYDHTQRPVRYERYAPFPSRGEVMGMVANFQYPTDEQTTWVLQVTMKHLQPPNFTEDRALEWRYWLSAVESGDVWPPGDDRLGLRIGDAVKDSRTTPPIVFSLETAGLPSDEQIAAIGEAHRRANEERVRLEAAGIQAPRSGLDPRATPWYLRPGIRYGLVGSACGALLLLAVIRLRRRG
jgi:hypothetical protein